MERVQKVDGKNVGWRAGTDRPKQCKQHRKSEAGCANCKLRKIKVCSFCRADSSNCSTSCAHSVLFLLFTTLSFLQLQKASPRTHDDSMSGITTNLANMVPPFGPAINSIMSLSSTNIDQTKLQPTLSLLCSALPQLPSSATLCCSDDGRGTSSLRSWVALVSLLISLLLLVDPRTNMTNAIRN